jgi:hypothetical protein
MLEGASPENCIPTLLSDSCVLLCPSKELIPSSAVQLQHAALHYISQPLNLLPPGHSPFANACFP